jgi:hypothetical protein
MAMTDRQVEQQIAQDAAAATAAAAAPDTPVTAGIFQEAKPAGAIVLPDGSKAPGSATMVGPVAQGAAPLGPAANFYPTPSPTTVKTVDSNGKVIGVTTTTYNWDGTPNTPQYTPIASTGPTGATGSAINPNTSTDYISAAQQQLMNWGILNANDPNSTDLMNQITTLAQQGAQPDTIALTIQNSPAYKARFSGNDARVAAGFSAYSAADYMTAENNYRSILSESGVPDKYQTQSFLASLIGKNVGTTTLQNYVNMASQLATTQDPYMLQTAYQQYGLTQGDLVAHFLDPNTAVPILQQQFAGTQIAAEAARQNMALNQQNALSLAAQGVTQQQAQTGFTNIGSQLAQQQQIAASLGGNPANIGSELTAAQFNANVNGISAAQAQQELTRQRAGLTSLYSGSSGAGKGSLYTEQSGVS